jgi:translin
MNNLDSIIEDIRAQFEAKNAARDRTLTRSRELIRLCAQSIRATHREEFQEAEALLDQARTVAGEMTAAIADHPDLYYTGYTQDALKEVVEASTLLAIVYDQALPTPQEVGVPGAAYLNGLAEAATELRRHILDRIRQGHNAKSERLLQAMDDIYSKLITIDYPDAITQGLRRSTDIVRGVLERTRGDLTLTQQQEKLKQSLHRFEDKLDNT